MAGGAVFFGKTIIRPRIYLAGSGRRGGLLDLVRYRRDFGQRLSQMGFDLIEPYFTFLQALEKVSLTSLEALPAEEQFRVFSVAIKEAASDDPYFRVLAARLDQFGSLEELETIRFSSIASSDEVIEVHDLDAQRIGAADAMVAYLPKPSEGTHREALVARAQRVLSFGFGKAADTDANGDLFTAIFPDFDALAPALYVFASGEGPYLTSAPVNSAKGNLLIYGIDLARLAPHIVAQVAVSLPEPRQVYSFCCERSHIHELAQKLPVMLRVGAIQSVTILTKDGSPHDVQMHTMAQEVMENMRETLPLRHFVVEKGALISVGAESVKRSRHLHSIAVQSPAAENVRQTPDEKLCWRGRRSVAVLVGGTSDLPIVEASNLVQTLKDASLDVQLEIISSDRQPERLRQLCLDNRNEWSIVIAVAGGVPNLPVVVKSWLPDLPVIGVPVEEEPMLASYSLTTPSSVPILMTGFGERGLKKAARVCIQLMEWQAS